jgi:hypothetical protein
MRKPVQVSIIAFITIVLLTFMGWVIPYRVSDEVIYRRQISANYPFAGDLVVNGQRVGASTELCTRFWLGREDSIRVVRFDCLLVTRRYPAKSSPDKQTF